MWCGGWRREGCEEQEGEVKERVEEERWFFFVSAKILFVVFRIM